LPNTTDPNGDFNYRYAFAAGDGPHPYSLDGGFPHWGSAGKTANHPTHWMNDFMQRFGIDPMALRDSQVTPEMQQFMSNQLSNAPFSYMPPSAF
jgi:hypothetical protein